ncbi:multiple coagulation factor deficiency protein 2 homolog isoform X1 [Lytechinus variegatus]|uniref:multiple coagulation factor deficiency protein 2 homolog isoform X1 n=1 Tax=Lytechinus variegatus TaxID=7654 RepID=UPI001BB25A35|nr:multiple coagulation factor deficiency protein 2 homolog isoform X1 [Lytechinus variegatus]
MMNFHQASLHGLCLAISMVMLFQPVFTEEEHHIKVGPPASLIRDRTHIQDRDHIRSHLQGTLDVDAIDMSPQRLQFHYFHSHDMDHNRKLDGLELMQSILHVDEGWKNTGGGGGGHHGGVMSEERIIEIVDVILEDDDIDQDGYVDYIEFSRGLDDGSTDEEEDYDEGEEQDYYDDED